MPKERTPSSSKMQSKQWSNWYYLLALLAGSSLTLAFAPIEWRIIGIISPAILFILLLQADSLKKHLRLSYLFGIGMFGTGTSWIFYSMYFFAHAHIVLAITLTSVFVILMSLVMLIFGALSYQFINSPKLTRLLLFYPASWVLVEWFRGWFFTGFPWLYLGNLHIDNSLVHIAPIAGSYAVSLLSIILSGALVLLFFAKNSHRITALIVGIGIIASSYTLGKIDWTTPLGDPIKVSLLQGNIPQDKKWLPEQQQPTLDLYLELTHENWDSDLIIWPETAIAGYFRNHIDSLILPLESKAKETHTDLLIGGFFQNDAGTPGAENSVLSITQNGRSIYSKRHLVPFSEYIPFLEYLRWLEKWIDLPYSSVKKGLGPTTINVAGKTAQMSICYEDVYGNESIRGLPEASLLINVSNDGWFTGSIEPEQHAEIARMRSVESGRYMLRSTNIGVSAIIDTKGKIVATAPTYKIKTITGMAQPYEGATPYVRVGNWLIISLLSLLILVGRFRRPS